jgi:hypothetical protein
MGHFLAEKPLGSRGFAVQQPEEPLEPEDSSVPDGGSNRQQARCILSISFTLFLQMA